MRRSSDNHITTYSICNQIKSKPEYSEDIHHFFHVFREEEKQRGVIWYTYPLLLYIYSLSWMQIPTYLLLVFFHFPAVVVASIISSRLSRNLFSRSSSLDLHLSIFISRSSSLDSPSLNLPSFDSCLDFSSLECLLSCLRDSFKAKPVSMYFKELAWGSSHLNFKKRLLRWKKKRYS